MATRRAVLGDAHVDRAVAGTTDFTAPFQDFITRYAWGEVWNRPGLDRRTRSAITLTALTALRAENEIAMHVRGAIANGLTPEEIGEVILHTAVYAGVPAANAAFAIAQRTLAELDVPRRARGTAPERGAGELRMPVESAHERVMGAQLGVSTIDVTIAPPCGGSSPTGASPPP